LSSEVRGRAEAAGQRRVLIISHDVVGERMAGPGIRYYHLARVLSKHAATTLAVPGTAPEEPAPAVFAIRSFVRQDWPSLQPLVAGADVVVFQGILAYEFPELAGCGACLVVDGYDPQLAEALAVNAHLPEGERAALWQQSYARLDPQYALGDFFVCASERQRAWWLGLLEARGRVNPWTFGEDASLRRLVDVVPFGLPDTAPQHTRQVIKGVWPGIAESDQVILWGGGLWSWLDPLTAIRALARITRRRPGVKLVFPGTRHPNPASDAMPNLNQAAMDEAGRLGLLERSVFFGDWVPYADWPNVLLESDLALSLHHDTFETQLAWRSRVLDYIWSGLPIVTTRGDATSETIAAHGLGLVVEYEDVEGVATAIEHLLDAPRAALNQQFERARQSLTWERAAAPLIRYCLQPRRAPDKDHLPADPRAGAYETEKMRLRNERDYWHGLAERYAQGRFMRMMRRLSEARATLGRRAQ